MNTSGPAYFDTLPVHPQPQPLESLISYLTRLVEANRLRSLPQLFRLCFPTERSQLTLYTGDYPPRSFGTLPTLAQCTEPGLLRTTFYHVGKKFDRLLKPHALAQFLSGGIAPYLRYCPACLVERGYYSLLWRFLDLEGCPEHGCQLLNRCEHCGQAISLLASGSKLGICPTCQGDLRHCQSERLPENRLKYLQARGGDLTYLISPQPYELSPAKITRLIGEQFTHWRLLRQLKITDIAQALELSPAILYYIETGPEHRGIKLQWYVEYAAFLRVSLPAIFEATVPRQPVQSDEEKLVVKIQQALAILEPSGKPVTQTEVRQMICIGFEPFTRYPRIKALWAEYRARWRQRREQGLADQVQQAIEGLKQQGQGVTLAAVSQQVGLSRQGLKHHPQAFAIWAKHRGYTPRKRIHPAQQKGEQTKIRPSYQREDELVKQVQQAIESLTQQGQPVSQKAIGVLVGLSPTGLNYYPQVKAMLQASQMKRSPRDEAALIDQVQAALVSLEVAGTRITLKAVSRQMGLSPNTLKYYPRVEAFVTEHITQKYQEHRTRQRQRREAELMVQVQQAIDQLRNGGKRLTQTAICQMVERSSVSLKQYPRVRGLLQQHGLTKA